MPRKMLLFAALAVVGSMLVLWLVTRDKRESSASTSPQQYADTRAPTPGDNPRPSLTDDPTQPSRPTPSESPGIKNPKSTDPSRPNAGTVENVERGTHAGEATEPPLEYTLPDGRKVRDFRAPQNRKPLDLPPSVHAPGGRKIPPTLTELYTNEIMKGMKECGQAMPKESLGPKPRLEGQIVIAIKGAQGTVSNAVFKLTDISSESLAETARQCVEQKALSVKVPATGEADLDSYSINLSFAFP